VILVWLSAASAGPASAVALAVDRPRADFRVDYIPADCLVPTADGWEDDIRDRVADNLAADNTSFLRIQGGSCIEPVAAGTR
jgi:hypothetical protein